MFVLVSAFSYFSVCEYIIAYTNMGYHMTAVLDFKDKVLLFGTYTPQAGNGSITNNNNIIRDKCKVPMVLPHNTISGNKKKRN